jgi:hypothetical protein
MSDLNKAYWFKWFHPSRAKELGLDSDGPNYIPVALVAVSDDPENRHGPFDQIGQAGIASPQTMFGAVADFGIALCENDQIMKFHMRADGTEEWVSFHRILDYEIIPPNSIGTIREAWRRGSTSTWTAHPQGEDR